MSRLGASGRSKLGASRLGASRLGASRLGASRRGALRPWRIAVMGAVYLFLYTPIVLLVAFSFNDSRFTSEWHGFTLRWYGNVLGSREWLGAAWATLHIAVTSAAIATCLGTTAALGLAIRAAGVGRKVRIYQFLKPKSLELGERKALKQCPLPITIECLDLEWDMTKSLDDPETVAKTRTKIAELCEQIATIAAKGKDDVIILDEIVFCVAKQLAAIESVKNIIEQKADGVEIVMTGRGATEELIEMADLVTEMKAIKHPFDKGINARKGIEF